MCLAPFGHAISAFLRTNAIALDRDADGKPALVYTHFKTNRLSRPLPIRGRRDGHRLLEAAGSRVIPWQRRFALYVGASNAAGRAQHVRKVLLAPADPNGDIGPHPQHEWKPAFGGSAQPWMTCGQADEEAG